MERRGEQVGDKGAGFYNLLEVVQQQEQVLVVQVVLESIPKQCTCCLPYLQRLGYLRHHKRGIADGSQVDKPHSIAIVVQQLGGCLQTQAGLARAPCTSQRKQTDVHTPKQRVDCFRFSMPSYKGGQRNGQVGSRPTRCTMLLVRI